MSAPLRFEQLTHLTLVNPQKGLCELCNKRSLTAASCHSQVHVCTEACVRFHEARILADPLDSGEGVPPSGG